MKNLQIYLSVLLIIMTMAMDAQELNASLQRAVNQGKSDLIEALSKAGDQFNFGIKADDVKSSSAATPLTYHEMNFDKLVAYSNQNMNDLINSEMKKIVPFVKGTKVITTVGISTKNQVTELINHQFHQELNELPEDIRQQGFKDVKIIYVPNLNTTIYSVNGTSYTTYKGRSLREPIEDAALLSVLKTDATAFKAKYGKQLKDGRLLN